MCARDCLFRGGIVAHLCLGSVLRRYSGCVQPSRMKGQLFHFGIVILTCATVVLDLRTKACDQLAQPARWRTRRTGADRANLGGRRSVAAGGGGVVKQPRGGLRHRDHMSLTRPSAPAATERRPPGTGDRAVGVQRVVRCRRPWDRARSRRKCACDQGAIPGAPRNHVASLHGIVHRSDQYNPQAFHAVRCRMSVSTYIGPFSSARLTSTSATRSALIVHLIVKNDPKRMVRNYSGTE
jgi:hypothetical protein